MAEIILLGSYALTFWFCRRGQEPGYTPDEQLQNTLIWIWGSLYATFLTFIFLGWKLRAALWAVTW